jgi:hypothetical protein
MFKAYCSCILFCLALATATCSHAATVVCGGVDDTAAIQAALTMASNPTSQPQTVVLPEGTCVITNTLVVGAYGSLVGSGNATRILAKYSSWSSNANGNYDAIELTSSASMADQRLSGNRRISGFRLEGEGNGGVRSTGLRVFYAGPNAGLSVSGQFALLSFDHLLIDTAMDLSDITASSISDVSISTVRQGIVVAGQAVNLTMSHIQMQYSSYSGPYTPCRAKLLTGC